jgi:guanine deaminase
MGEAYKVAKLRGEDFKPTDLFYTATLGAAVALGLDQITGSLTEGRKADFQIIDPSKNILLKRRLNQVESIEQMIFALVHHCDDRCVEQVYVDGKRLVFPATQSLI